VQRQMVFHRLSDWGKGRAWRAEECEDPGCPFYHENSVEGTNPIRVHPMKSDAFLLWRDSGAPLDQIPEDCLVIYEGSV
jgi:hypothetical protein